MLTYVKWTFLALSIGSILYTIALIVSSKPGIKQALDIAALQTGAKVVNPDMTEYNGNQLVWRLQAETAQEQEDSLELEKPRLKMVLNDGEIVPIEANHGQYEKTTKQLHFQGDVVVLFQDWDLRSQSMDYYKERDELVTPGAFVLKQEGIYITGKHLQILRPSGKLKVLQGVHMVLEEAL